MHHCKGIAQLAALGKDLANGFSTECYLDRLSRRVGNMHFRIDAEDLVDCRADVSRGDGIVFDVGGLVI